MTADGNHGSSNRFRGRDGQRGGTDVGEDDFGAASAALATRYGGAATRYGGAATRLAASTISGGNANSTTSIAT